MGVVIPLRRETRETDSDVESTDAALIEAALAGIQSAKERLYRRHVRMVMGLAHRVLPADPEIDDLLSRHRGDSRAPLAAIELGRLRMDSLNDPAGAAQAFELALELGPSSPLREDALARLVRANDAAGRTVGWPE